MSKRLVTKLNGIVNNDSLLKLGELRIKIDKVQSPSKSNRSLTIVVNSSTNIRIIGEGYFTDENLSANKGKSLLLNPESLNYIYVSNNDVTVSVENKYNLTSIWCNAAQNPDGAGKEHNNIHINIDDLKYSTALTALNLSNTSVTGDIVAVKNLTRLYYLNLSNTSVTGDIAAVKNLTALTALNLSNTSVTGDIVAVKNLANLTNLFSRSNNTTGDISTISSLTKLSQCQLNRVTGDIAAINNTKITDIIISKSGGLTGDIAKLKSDFKYLGLDNDSTSKFTWSSRDSESFIFGNGGAPILSTSLDDMLINMAQCRNGLTSSSSTYVKGISYQGKRTSASDAAVETLQNYGYTISIIKA